MDYKLIICLCIVILIAFIFAIASVKIQDIANDTEEPAREFWLRVLIVLVSEILCLGLAVIVYMIFSKMSSTSDSEVIITESHENYTTQAVESVDTSNIQPPTNFDTNLQQA